MQFLLNSDYGAMKMTFETESLLSQSFSFKTYKIYITAIFTNLVWNCAKTKLYDIDPITLRLETRIGYICNTHSYQGEVCNGLEMKLT